MSAGFFCFPETLFFLVRFKSSGIFLEFNVIADEWFIKKLFRGKTVSYGIVISYIYYNTNLIKKSIENLILSKTLK